MPQAPQPSSWQTLFNLGGVAGALSFLWNLGTALRQRSRRPRLEFSDFVSSRDIFNVQMHPPATPESRRYLTLKVINIGKKSARGCVARAKAQRLSGAGSERTVSLHWADVAISYQSTGAAPVDISPGGEHRLDIAFSSSLRGGCHLASHSALHGHYYDDFRLDEGEFRVEIGVTFEDGDEAEYKLLIVSPAVWDRLEAAIDHNA
jgi:hypothetical protein